MYIFQQKHKKHEIAILTNRHTTTLDLIISWLKILHSKYKSTLRVINDFYPIFPLLKGKNSILLMLINKG